MKNPYATLEIPYNAKQEDIKKQWRKLSAKYHPDKGGDLKKSQEINSAYDFLKTDQQRFDYDKNELGNLYNIGKFLDGYLWVQAFLERNNANNAVHYFFVLFVEKYIEDESKNGNQARVSMIIADILKNPYLTQNEKDKFIKEEALEEEKISPKPQNEPKKEEIIVEKTLENNNDRIIALYYFFSISIFLIWIVQLSLDYSIIMLFLFSVCYPKRFLFLIIIPLLLKWMYSYFPINTYIAEFTSSNTSFWLFVLFPFGIYYAVAYTEILPEGENRGVIRLEIGILFIMFAVFIYKMLTIFNIL